MKRQVMAYLLATVVAIPVLAGLKTVVRLDGWIVDSYCRAKNANAESAEDTLACHKKGAKLILISADGTSYVLEDQERALEEVGKEVKIFGLVDEDRNLKITNYIGSDPPLTEKTYSKEEAQRLAQEQAKSSSKPGETSAPAEPTKKDD